MERLQELRTELASLVGKEKKQLRAAEAKEIRELERTVASSRPAGRAAGVDFERMARAAEEALQQVALAEETLGVGPEGPVVPRMEPAVVLQRLNEKNLPACSGKELRKERKELMREWQELILEAVGPTNGRGVHGMVPNMWRFAL